MKIMINSKKVYNGKFLDMFVDTMVDENGKEIKWERCSRKNKTNAVAIVPYHVKRNKFVLIDEYRIPIKGREIGFPAGLLDKENESFTQAIARELKEETGLDLVSVIRVSPMGFNSAGMTDEAISFAYVLVDGDLSDKFLENTEDIHAFFASKYEIKHMLYDKNVKWGAKAWVICDMLVNGSPFA